MLNRKCHLVKEGDNFKSILSQYSMNESEFKALNPLINQNNLFLGQIIYIIDHTNERQTIVKDAEYSKLLSELHLKIKMHYMSYIDKNNDIMLIEELLKKDFDHLAKLIFKDKDNEQILFSSLMQNLHKSTISFIDSLIAKNQDKIKKSKTEIKENIKNLSQFLTNQKIDYQIENLSKIIENNLLIIAKLISKNYFDTWELTDSNIKISLK